MKATWVLLFVCLAVCGSRSGHDGDQDVTLPKNSGDLLSDVSSLDGPEGSRTGQEVREFLDHGAPPGLGCPSGEEPLNKEQSDFLGGKPCEKGVTDCGVWDNCSCFYYCQCEDGAWDCRHLCETCPFD